MKNKSLKLSIVIGVCLIAVVLVYAKSHKELSVEDKVINEYINCHLESVFEVCSKLFTERYHEAFKKEYKYDYENFHYIEMIGKGYYPFFEDFEIIKKEKIDEVKYKFTINNLYVNFDGTVPDIYGDNYPSFPEMIEIAKNKLGYTNFPLQEALYADEMLKKNNTGGGGWGYRCIVYKKYYEVTILGDKVDDVKELFDKRKIFCDSSVDECKCNEQKSYRIMDTEKFDREK